jgi:hypothetical protein
MQPFQFIAGKPVSERRARKSDGGAAGGSFSGFGGPKPPPALSTSVLGMKKGGKVSDVNLAAFWPGLVIEFDLLDNVSS